MGDSVTSERRDGQPEKQSSSRHEPLPDERRRYPDRDFVIKDARRLS